MKRMYSTVLSVIFSLNIISAQAMPSFVNEDFKAWAGQNVQEIKDWGHENCNYVASLPGAAYQRALNVFPWKSQGFDGQGDFREIGFGSWAGNKAIGGAKGALHALDRVPALIARNWRLSYQFPLKAGSSALSFAKEYPGLAAVTVLSLTVGSYHLYSINALRKKIDEFESTGSGCGKPDSGKFSFACWNTATWNNGHVLLQNQEAVWKQLKQRVNFPEVLYKQPELDVLSQVIQDMWQKTDSIKKIADALAQIMSRNEQQAQNNFAQLSANEVNAKQQVDNIDILSRIITEKLWFEQQLDYLATFTDMPKKITEKCKIIGQQANEKEPLVKGIEFVNNLDEGYQDFFRYLEKVPSSFRHNIFYQSTWFRPWKFRMFPWPEYAGQTYLKMFKYYARLRALYTIVTGEVQKSAPKTTKDMVAYVRFILRAQLSQYNYIGDEARKTTLLAAMITLIECIHSDYYRDEDEKPFDKVLVHLQAAQNGNNVDEDIGQAIGKLNAQQG